MHQRIFGPKLLRGKCLTLNIFIFLKNTHRKDFLNELNLKFHFNREEINFKKSKHS